MKIQHLAIIFVLIILPIDIVLGLYLDAQINTLRNQSLFDGRLVNCVYDAVEVYKSNSIVDTENNIVTEKMNNIEASASTFLTSLQTAFGYSGYKATVMQEYVPAVVYTMYDGYYIYSKFNNTTSQVNVNPYSTYYDGATIEGLKSYVFYSCRYYRDNDTANKDDDDDFVITYSLDNYITIQGQFHGKYDNISGYLIDGIEPVKNGSNIIGYKYDGIEFTEDGRIDGNYYGVSEFVGDTEYKYVKINGTKYYYDEANKEIFHIVNGVRLKQVKEGEKNYQKYVEAITKNKSAYLYYKEAYEFTNKIRNDFDCTEQDKKDIDGNVILDEDNNPVKERIFTGYGLSDLSSKNAVYSEGNEKKTITDFGNYNVFKKNSSVPIQDSDSEFNQHRAAVIRYSIETNLIAAIAGFSEYSEQIEFAMPKIKETDWEIIENNVSVIGFLQGLDLGTKKYNGYAVVANTTTNEYVDEDAIYIITDKQYHRANATDLSAYSSYIGPRSGIFMLDFERHYLKTKDNSTGSTVEKITYYYPKRQSSGETSGEIYTASYSSVINQTEVNISYDDMYKYMRSLGTNENNIYNDELTKKIKKAYYIALGRERYGSYKIGHDTDYNYFLKNF